MGKISVSQTVFNPATNDCGYTTFKMQPRSGSDFASNNAIFKIQTADYESKLFTQQIHPGRDLLVLSDALADISLETGIAVPLLYLYKSCVNTYKLVPCYWTKEGFCNWMDNMLHNHSNHLHWTLCADETWNSIDAQNEMIVHMADAGLAVIEPVKNYAGNLKFMETLITDQSLIIKTDQSLIIKTDQSLIIKTSQDNVRILKFIPGKTFYETETWNSVSIVPLLCTPLPDVLPVGHFPHLAHLQIAHQPPGSQGADRSVNSSCEPGSSGIAHCLCKRLVAYWQEKRQSQLDLLIVNSAVLMPSNFVHSDMVETSSCCIGSLFNMLPVTILNGDEKATYSKHVKRLILACSAQIVPKVKYFSIKLMDTFSQGQEHFYYEIMMYQTRNLLEDNDSSNTMGHRYSIFQNEIKRQDFCFYQDLCATGSVPQNPALYSQDPSGGGNGVMGPTGPCSAPPSSSQPRSVQFSQPSQGSQEQSSGGFSLRKLTQKMKSLIIKPKF